MTCRFLQSANNWFFSWILLAALLCLAFVLPILHPDVSYIRSRARAEQCRDQMEVIVEAEQEHFLDHRSFTTEQNALSRYRPFAERAACPLCGDRYVIEFTSREIYIRCPCQGSNHGWTHGLAPDTMFAGPPQSLALRAP